MHHSAMGRLTQTLDLNKVPLTQPQEEAMRFKTLSSVCFFVFATNSFALNLEIKANETVTLKPGSYRYENLSMGSNSAIIYTGDTKILVNNLSVDSEARIAYAKGVGTSPNKYLDLVVTNAKDVHGALHIIGNGKDGTNGNNGNPGNDGQDEHSGVRIEITRKLGVPVPYPHPWHVDPTPGTSGTRGTSGERGENGISINASIFDLGADSLIYIQSNGGNGGNGGDGGKGGNGGAGKIFNHATNGGDGGAGGNGGDGGNAGYINASLVYLPEVSQEKIDSLTKMLDVNIVALPGLGGIGGLSGQGGANGEGGPGSTMVRIGTVVRVSVGAGYSGTVGSQGSEGSKGANTTPEKRLIPFTQWSKEQSKVLEELLKIKS